MQSDSFLEFRIIYKIGVLVVFHGFPSKIPTKKLIRLKNSLYLIEDKIQHCIIK